ncbi:MAG TPA: isochorismatase family protein [bacterium]|nr:isochorismatase family protein [bacterium]
MREKTLKLNLRSRVRVAEDIWEERIDAKIFSIDKTAILLCDIWDNHWCSGAKKRVDILAPRINRVVSVARENGIQIIHSPSDTMDFYKGTVYRKRILEVPRIEPVELLSFYEPPLPIDDSDGGCDSGEKPWYKAWTREHPAIEIRGNDVISDNGIEIYSFLRYLNIDTLIYIGFHTNMCILKRPFGIRNMKRYGINCILVRDLTDAMYNPDMPPYVSHEKGTELVIQHIEKYLCPTILSEDLEKLY